MGVCSSGLLCCTKRGQLDEEWNERVVDPTLLAALKSNEDEGAAIDDQQLQETTGEAASHIERARDRKAAQLLILKAYKKHLTAASEKHEQDEKSFKARQKELQQQKQQAIAREDYLAAGKAKDELLKIEAQLKKLAESKLAKPETGEFEQQAPIQAEKIHAAGASGVQKQESRTKEHASRELDDPGMQKQVSLGRQISSFNEMPAKWSSELQKQISLQSLEHGRQMSTVSINIAMHRQASSGMDRQASSGLQRQSTTGAQNENRAGMANLAVNLDGTWLTGEGEKVGVIQDLFFQSSAVQGYGTIESEITPLSDYIVCITIDDTEFYGEIFVEQDSPLVLHWHTGDIWLRQEAGTEPQALSARSANLDDSPMTLANVARVSTRGTGKDSVASSSSSSESTSSPDSESLVALTTSPEATSQL